MGVAVSLLTRGSRAVDTFEKTPHVLMAQVRDGTLTKGDLFAYITICEIAFAQGGEVNLPQQELAAAVACKPRMLRYHMAALLDAGWILARKLGNGGRACAYRPVTPADRANGKILPLARTAAPTKRQHSAVQVATGLPVERQYIAAVNRQTPEDPEQTGIPESGSPVAGSAPAPARKKPQAVKPLDGPPRPVPKPQPLPADPAAEPPPPPPPPRKSRRTVERTDPPETLEPTPAQRAWALGHGFTETTLADEIERCLDHHRIEVKDSGNWHASLRTWLKNELAYAAEDGRQPGVRVGRARPKVPAARAGYTAPVTGWPGAPTSTDARRAASYIDGLPT